jgi:hypothetical protein
MAVSLFALLGMVALAVDLGMLLKVRGDAQRAADAAALAGAAEFLTGKAYDRRNEAAIQAWQFAGSNTVGWYAVDTSGPIFSDSGTRRIVNTPEAYIQVIPDEYKVRVFIRRAATSTWFGNLLGLDFVTITAKSAAVATNAGESKCVKPFALPDTWDETGQDNIMVNDLWDVGPKGKTGGGGADTEAWEYTVADNYVRYEDPSNLNPSAWTGLGSGFRNNQTYYYNEPSVYTTTGVKYYDDFGRPVVIKQTDPNTAPAPGNFYPFVMGVDPNNPGAYEGAPAPNPGANWYSWNIANCNPVGVKVNDPTAADTSKPGNMVGPTHKGLMDLVDLDPLACWAEFPDPNHFGFTTGEVRKRLTANGPCDQAYAAWESSPRTILVPLMDPSQIDNGRLKNLKFNNLALFFLEPQKNKSDPVVARFLYFAKGTATGPTTGSLVKKLQLVE